MMCNACKVKLKRDGKVLTCAKSTRHVNVTNTRNRYNRIAIINTINSNGKRNCMSVIKHNSKANTHMNNITNIHISINIKNNSSRNNNSNDMMPTNSMGTIQRKIDKYIERTRHVKSTRKSKRVRTNNRDINAYRDINRNIMTMIDNVIIINNTVKVTCISNMGNNNNCECKSTISIQVIV